MGHRETIYNKNSSNLNHQWELWCINKDKKSVRIIKIIQLQNVLGINYVLKSHYSVFKGNTKKLLGDFSNILCNADFNLGKVLVPPP